MDYQAQFSSYKGTNGSLFLSFEGIEGSGKTTQINKVKEYFEAKDYKVFVLREPGGTKFGEKLREAILRSEVELHPLAEANLFAASRAQLLSELILPHLEKEKAVVILDRYIDSSIAYQGVARGLGVETVLKLHSSKPLNIMPNKTFYLDIDLETSMHRQSLRGQTKDYFEKRPKEFYLNLIKGYQECSRLFPERIIKIDAKNDIKQVEAEILKQISNL